MVDNFSRESFGTANGTLPLVKKPLTMPKMWTRRKLLSAVAAVLVPWIMFSAIFWILSFYVHYVQPDLAGFVIGACAALAFISSALSLWSCRLTKMGRPTSISSMSKPWALILTASLTFAVVLGIFAGCTNFHLNMKGYYDIVDMHFYTAIDPSKQGAMYTDAGRAMFQDAGLKLEWSSGFVNDDVYCVAPIVSRSIKNSSYDFWAVGMNCCSGDRPDFHCGMELDPHVHAGVRLLDSTREPFFRLAVQQVESRQGIKSANPMFFEWVQDPIKGLQEQADFGLQCYVLGTLLFLGNQIFVVMVASIALTKFSS